jgi:putative oxidoreductase
MQGAGQPPLPRTCLAFALAIVFVATGAGKLIDHAGATADFARWGVPDAATVTIVVGLLELGAAALLMMGIATRRVALALATEMALALAIAGRADGGVQLVVPPAVGALCLVLGWAARGDERDQRVPAR